MNTSNASEILTNMVRGNLEMLKGETQSMKTSKMLEMIKTYFQST